LWSTSITMDYRPSRVQSNHEGLERMKVYKERRAKTVGCIMHTK